MRGAAERLQGVWNRMRIVPLLAGRDEPDSDIETATDRMNNVCAPTQMVGDVCPYMIQGV